MGDNMEWVEMEDTFFEQGEQFELEAGWMAVEDAKQKVLGNIENAIGVCIQPGGDPDQSYCAIIKVGTSKYESPGSGWTSFVFKHALPPSDGCFQDDFAETEEAGTEYEWERPGRGDGLGDDIRDLSLFSSIDPNDLAQGGLGDCWLISAFSSMAEFPENLMALFDQKIITEDGKYDINLYSYESQGMVKITIDDRLPEKRGMCAYQAITNDGEIWAALLEKAFAKYSGGYQELKGGQSIFAFGAMTGCTDLQILSRNDDSTWAIVNPKWTTDKVHEIGDCYVDDTKSDDEVLAMIQDFDNQNFLMCCGSHSGSDSDTSDLGVVQGHAYSLIQVKTDVCGTGVNLLQCRNPWGQTEWKGDWSDASSLWDEHPDVAAECGHTEADDGLFWIDWEDFVANYSSIYVCKKNMGYSRGKQVTIASNSAPVSDDVVQAPKYTAKSAGLKKNRSNQSFFGKLMKMFSCC